MRWNDSPFGNKLHLVSLMVTQLKNAAVEFLARLGITSEEVVEFETRLGTTEGLNVEQETLKARLKDKTAELDAEFEVLEDIYLKFKRKIKAEVAQELWREYGIDDSR